MTAVALTAASVGAVYPANAEIYDVIAVEAITVGQAVYFTTAGKAGVADANASGKQQFRGIALTAAAAGQAVSVLKRGHVYGFTLTSLTWGDIVYLSDTAGSLDTAAGTMTVNCGRVVSIPDNALTKVLYIDADWLRAWS